MEQIINISIDTLKIHPRNEEFFDNIEGEQYVKFKKSIEEDGILTPLIVSPDMTIISGHQRYQAGKDLGYKLIPVIIKEDLIEEDEKLKKLLATNFGRLKNDVVKQGKVISEYEKLCGVSHGGSRPKNSALKITQKDLAEQFGISVDTLQNLKKLQTLSPDLQELISDGTVKYTTALSVWSKLSQEEQSKLIEDLGRDKIKTLTQKATEEYIVKNSELEQRLKQEQSKPPKVKEVIIDNTDYTIDKKAKQLQESLNTKNIEMDRLKRKLDLMTERAEIFEENSNEYKDLKRQIEVLSKEKDDIGKSVKSATELSGLIHNIENLLKTELCPINYSRAILDMSDNQTVMSNLKEIIEVVEKWCGDMRKYLPQNQQNIIIDVEEV